MMRRTPRAAAIAMAWLLALGLAAFGAVAVAQEVEPPPTATEFADEPTGDEATAERAEDAGLDHSEEHGAGEGMPQLNASTYASQILWLIITFAILFYLLRTKALPRVADILEARQERISNDLDKAAALRQEAEEAAEEYAKVLADAQAKASEAIKSTRDAVSADIGGRTATLDKELGAKITAAEATVRKARDQAMSELEGVAVEVAQAATMKLVGVEVTTAEAEAALAEVRKDVA